MCKRYMVCRSDSCVRLGAGRVPRPVSRRTAMSAASTPSTALTWEKEDDPRWDDDRERVFGSVPAGVFRTEEHVSGDPLPSDWWRVVAKDQVVGYGWLDDVWGDAEVLLAVDAPARGTGAGSFALA